MNMAFFTAGIIDVQAVFFGFTGIVFEYFPYYFDAGYMTGFVYKIGCFSAVP